MKTILSVLTNTPFSRSLRLAAVTLIALAPSAYNAMANSIALPTAPGPISLPAVGHGLVTKDVTVTVRSTGDPGATLTAGAITIVLVRTDGTIAGVGSKHLRAVGSGQVDQSVTVPVILDQGVTSPNCTVKYAVFGHFSVGVCASSVSTSFPNILSTSCNKTASANRPGPVLLSEHVQLEEDQSLFPDEASLALPAKAKTIGVHTVLPAVILTLFKFILYINIMRVYMYIYR